MPQRQLPERDPEPDPEPHIETPIIDIQDLEHQPSLDELAKEVEINLAKEDEKARKAVEEFEESVKVMPPD